MSTVAGTFALVSGASRGIGAATARALEAQGARVVGLARSLSDARGATRWDRFCDLTSAEQVERVAVEILAEWGPPDIVVNNAGSFLLSPLGETSTEQFEAQLRTNLLAPFTLARAFLPAMADAGGGLHITIGSVADHVGFPGNTAYAASKWGLRGLHTTLAAEFAESGLRFSLISPGPTDTAAWDEVDPDNRPGFLPRKAMLRAEDVADAVCYVAGRPRHMTVELLRLGPAPSRNTGK